MVRRVDGILRKTLRMILEASKDIYPREFGAFLRAEEGLITELVMIPGTVSGKRHAIFQTWMLPANVGVVGTVHSHPSGVYLPSDEDRSLFSNFGGLHVIVGRPFTEETWAAYTSKGEPYPLRIVT